MILADQEIQIMRDSTRERKLSRNFIDWYTYQFSLESEHYRLPWFQYQCKGGSNPSETWTPISTCGFEKPSVGHPIVEEVEELPGISEREEIQDILQFNSRARHTRRDQGIGQSLLKLLPETLRHDSQRLGIAKEEMLWSVELDGDFDWNTLWWILMAIGTFVSYYIYPGLQHLLHFYAENLQARLIDAGCLGTPVVPYFESSLLPTAFICGFVSGNTFVILLVSLQVRHRLILEYSELGAYNPLGFRGRDPAQQVVALDIASRFLVKANLACPRTAKEGRPRRELNVYAFDVMVVLVAIFIATFRW